MARKPQIPKRDAERALKVLEYERKTEPKYRRPNTFGAYALLLIGLAVAGLIVYYVHNHKEQFSDLWHRATHPEAPTAPAYPDQ
jgi:hypothetical protein